MPRPGAIVVLASLLVNGGLLLGVRSRSRTIYPSISSGKIKHVVIIFQENRTPDNLFHGLPNADIANTGVNSKGQTVTLGQVNLANNYQLAHTHYAFTVMYDHGKMDGADRVGVSCAPQAVACPPANPQFQYVNPQQVEPYFQMAEQYVFADRMFQTHQGNSFPAHQFILAGTSAPTATSPLFAADNPLGAPNATDDTGCTAPAGEFVSMIDPSGHLSSQMYPCFEHATITDELDARSINWKYYTPSAGSMWTGPNAIQHICEPQTVNGELVCTGPDWTSNVIIPQTQVLTDIAKGRLGHVSWVIPNGQESDHPVSNNGSGPSWVASVVNAIGNSPYWATTAILITWDDWGGWYDHVAPTVINSFEYGFRVPLIVVSPYAKAGYVSHVTHDFGSILRFVEDNYGLPTLGFADSHADDLSDCFNFQQTPIPFRTITAPLGAEYFLNDRRPPLDPDDD
jgi:phospholipase C